MYIYAYVYIQTVKLQITFPRTYTFLISSSTNSSRNIYSEYVIRIRRIKSGKVTMGKYKFLSTCRVK